MEHRSASDDTNHRRRASLPRGARRASITAAFSNVKLTDDRGHSDTISSTQSQPITQDAGPSGRGLAIRAKLSRQISVDVTSETSQDFLW